jgi:hypothetical protein
MVIDLMIWSKNKSVDRLFEFSLIFYDVSKGTDEDF